MRGQVGHALHTGFVMPCGGTVIRGPPILGIKKYTLLPSMIQEEHTHCLAPLLCNILVLLLSLLLVLFTKRQEKYPSTSRSGTSKFEVNAGIFQKTVHLGNLGNCTVKVTEASSLTPVQDLLFQLASFKGTSQQGGHTEPNGGTCPSESTKREDVDAALPRTD